MGPSGSEKSTLLNLIAALDHVDTGTIRVGGVDITAYYLKCELGQAWTRRQRGLIVPILTIDPVLTASKMSNFPCF